MAKKYFDNLPDVDKTALKESVGITTDGVAQFPGKTEIGTETNLIKSTVITDGRRLANAGYELGDSTHFMLDPVVVTVGDRYSSNIPAGNGVRFHFYTSDTIGTGTFVSYTVGKSATVPATANYMVVQAAIAHKDILIVQKRNDGTDPVDGEQTYELADPRISDNETRSISAPRYVPSVFSITPTNIETALQVLVVGKTGFGGQDVLYGTNGFREIFKATQKDLSDAATVLTLSSGSKLEKLLFTDNTRAVGYVRNPTTPADEGFYIFEDCDLATWTSRRPTDNVAGGIYRKMESGAPAFEFQSLVRAGSTNYLFAGSYGTKHLEGDSVVPPNKIYRSSDLGENWEVCYTYGTELNTHIHAVEWDAYRNRLWVLIGDSGNGGKPGWVYSDDYGDTFTFVAGGMDTAIIPARSFVIIGTDDAPAALKYWGQKKFEDKHAAVIREDIKYLHIVSGNRYEVDNFGFARNPAIDVSTYPYKIAMSFINFESYSHGALLISPDLKNWYTVEYQDDPSTDLGWRYLAGITSDGYIIGWGSVVGATYHRYVQFPEWVVE